MSEQNGGPPFWRNIDLVLELGMVARVKVGSDYLIDYPDTDARLEASLDFLEYQVMRALGQSMAPATIVFQKIARITNHQSQRQVEQESGVKLASRLLTLTCRVSDDQVDFIRSPATAPTGLDALPEPLRTVAKSLPAGSEALKMCEAYTGLTTAIVNDEFKGVDITVDADGAVPEEDHQVKASAELGQ